MKHNSTPNNKTKTVSIPYHKEALPGSPSARALAAKSAAARAFLGIRRFYARLYNCRLQLPIASTYVLYAVYIEKDSYFVILNWDTVKDIRNISMLM